MNLSGIVVAVPPTKLNEGIAALNAINNIEVHQSDELTGQIVIVQEAEKLGKANIKNKKSRFEKRVRIGFESCSNTTGSGFIDTYANRK